jgi:hypothetical protein
VRLRPVSCPRCGAPARLSEGETRTACSRCQAEITIESAHAIEARRGRQYPNRTPIKVGMRAMFRGREYEVIGRMVYSMVEAGATYCWDEWQLLAPDGHVLYLEHDEGHWKIMEPFVPRNPIGPATASSIPMGATLHLDDESARILQRARSTLCHVEGELTFAATVGAQRQYLDAGGLKHAYAVEWDEEEIEFYRGERVPYREVLVAFNLRAELKAIEAREARQVSQKSFALVCLTAAIVAMCGWILSTRPGRLVAKGSASIARIPDDGLRFGPYALPMTNRVYRLRINASLREASAWVAGAIETAAEQEVMTVQRDMWDETGYDSDGYWHESVLNSQTDFCPGRAGEHFVRLYAEWEGSTARTRSVQQFSGGAVDSAALGSRASFELYEGVLYPWYLAWFFFPALVLSIVFFMVSSPETRQKIGEAMSSSDDD